MATAFIKITRATYLSGQPAAVGEVYEVDAETAKLAVECKKAEIVKAPVDAVIDKPKPKVTRVSDKRD